MPGADRVLLVLFVALAALAWRRARLGVRYAELEGAVAWQLVKLLPLPHHGDRTTLLEILVDLAPGKPLALYTSTDPVLWIVSRAEHARPGPADARFIEVHRDRLARGQTVWDERCGTLLPVFSRDGDWRAVAIVGDTRSVTLDADARATLEHVAGLLRYGSALVRWNSPAPAVTR